ncbi:MAG: hypothetical protein JW806_05085 [Sedimentisphaerales bacterium]|nr:hypothetical protein [Sedimentisphaerales bacterium]
MPSQYTTIQAAINASFNGDMVIISPGTYTGIGNKDLDFVGRAITVRSTDPQDPNIVAATVIDCEQDGRGFVFQNGEDSNSVLSGLTVTNGMIDPYYDSAYGGGILCDGASPTITNCQIINNTTNGDYNNCGGGIACVSGSDSIIINCDISNNSVLGEAIFESIGWSYGGGIYCDASSIYVYNCKISGNTSKGGYGVSDTGYGDTPPPSAGRSYGGGIAIESGSSVIDNCLIIENRTVPIRDDYGYGASVGGGIACYKSNTIVRNCTIVGNDTFASLGDYSGGGGGIYGPATVINSIVWGNLSGNQLSDVLSVSYSDIEDGYAGTGNIDVHPSFVTGPLGDYYLSQAAAGQFNSPCVDAGSDMAANLGMDKYTTRTDEIYDGGIVDMGYHYPGLGSDNPDIDGDLIVNNIDLSILANDWRKAEPNLAGDLTRDWYVDFEDLLIMADAWLDCLVERARYLKPVNNALNVDINITLQWLAYYGALEHDVYLGTDADAVANADRLSEEFMGTVTNANFNTYGLDLYTSYYWRVDAVGPACTAKGNIWNFKTANMPKLTGVSGEEFGHSVGIDGNRCIVGAYRENAYSSSAYIFEWNGTSWEKTKLTTLDGASGDYFGRSVSIDGGRCIVGAYRDDDNGYRSGSAYIFEWNGTDWVQQAKLTASDGAAGDYFGISVSIDGDRCIIGAEGDDNNGSYSGSAYIFEWNGSNWIQQTKLTASDSASYDWFGQSVSIDGGRCIVGASGDDNPGGSAYIFEWNGTSWIEQTKLMASDGTEGNFFGYSVSIDGDRCIVGVYGDNNGDNTGSAYIFKWNGTGWVQQARLTASDGASGDSFGRSVSIDGDRCIIGARGDDDNGSYSGSAYIFEFNGASWEETKFTASDGASGDFFGWSVSIGGDYCIIGAIGDGDNGFHSGSAYVFQLDTQDETYYVPLAASDGDSGDRFGYSSSIDGESCIVGVIEDDDNGTNSGAAYIFERNGTDWDEIAKLIALDGTSEDMFGCSVSIVGSRCIVGAKGDDDNGANSGAAYIFEFNGTSWIQDAKLTASDGSSGDGFGGSVSISGNYCVIGADCDDDSGLNSGSVYIFEFNGTSWTQQAKLTASDSGIFDYFGCGVSIDGDNCIIGAKGGDGNKANTGAAYIFERNGSSWTEQYKLAASDGDSLDYFGKSVSINGGRCIIGALNDDDNGSQSGSAYIFEFNGSSWIQEAKLTALGGASEDYFGCCVGINGDRCIVGAMGNDDNGTDSGSAYLFKWNGAEWTQTKLAFLPGGSYDYFGCSAGISSDYCVVGAHGDDDNGADSGSACVFELDPYYHFKASNPFPTSGSNDVDPYAVVLSWTAGAAATSHDVYFGTVNPPPFIGNQAATSYEPGDLDVNTMYYWRIDEKNVSGTTGGTLWSFTTWSESEPIDPNLVGWWKFDEFGGTTANDSAGGDNDGTINGGATWIAGKINSALNFDGVDDDIIIPDNDDSLDMDNQMTITAWIRPDNFGSYYYVLVKRTSAVPGNYELRLSQTSGFLQFIHQTGATTFTTYTSTSSLATGTWQHVAITLEEGDSVNFYINGTPAGTLPQTAVFGIANDEPLRIGSRNGGYWFNGDLDDVRVYDRALSEAEVGQLYNEGMNP